jgi:hypothetical protein
MMPTQGELRPELPRTGKHDAMPWKRGSQTISEQSRRFSYDPPLSLTRRPSSHFDATTWLNSPSKTFFALPVCFTAMASSMLAVSPTRISATMPMP